MFKLFLAIVVSATIDSSTISIGDQTDIHLRATMDKTEQVALPQYDKEIIPEVEIVDRTIIDTAILSDGRVQLDQYLTITAFKDSLFYISPLPFVSGDDTIWSEGMSLNVVQPFQVDTTMAITDIKDIEKAPIWWWGIIRWILLALVIIGLGILVWWLIKKYYHPKPKLTPKEIELLRPADEVALEKLDQIKEEKVWQDGKVKQYHTQLTDVIREYIGRRYEVHSTEKTSGETLDELKPLMTEQKDLFESLRKMLSLADLVKFAKWTATPEENENALKTAYDFVKETTVIEAQTAENATETTAEATGTPKKE